jgi:stage II sporulation protein M
MSNESNLNTSQETPAPARGQVASFLHDYRRWISLVLWLFAISLVLGAITAKYYPGLMDQITEGFAEEFGESPALDYSLAQKIFIQNLTASGIALLGGLLLGIAPFAVVLVNGFLLGYVIMYVATATDSILTNIGFLAAGLIPHAIFELPAFLGASVLGLGLGLDWLSEGARGGRLRVLGRSFARSLYYFLWITAALVVAAIVEVFISGKLVEKF